MLCLRYHRKKIHHKVLPLWMQTTSMRCSSCASYRGSEQKPAWFPCWEFPCRDMALSMAISRISSENHPANVLMTPVQEFPTLSQTAQRTIKDNNKLVSQSVCADVACYIMYVLGQWVKNLWLSPWWADAGPLAMGPKWGRCRSIHSLLILLHYYLCLFSMALTGFF